MAASTILDGLAQVTAGDAVMDALATTYGPPKLGRRRSGTTRFEQLAEAICFQQLAGKAAESIWRRVRALVTDFNPEAVIDAGYDALRGAGLSNAKALSILDLATHVSNGTVRLDRIGRLDDDAIVQELTVVRGIGRWTAEMFLIFTLHRLDVWPVDDYGVRAGYARAYGLDELPTAKELAPLGDRFRPYRTIAAWYCWRAVETTVPT